jgi:hypothetical protein
MRGWEGTVRRIGALLAVWSAAACSGSDGGSAPVTIESVSVAPTSVTLAVGAAQLFTATAHMSDGGSEAASVTWSATGGDISDSGLYTAGATPGIYLVIARAQGGVLADTATVTIPSPPPPNLVAVEVTPSAATVQEGQALQFTATGRLSDDSHTTVPVVWTATGGTISGGGIYTAGSTPGDFLVIATEVGGPFADTSSVTVTAAPPTLVAIELTPPTATLVVGASLQFTAAGRYSDSGTQAVPIAWSATGGTVSDAGLYTAGAVAGTFRVVAQWQGGTLADTSEVTVEVQPAGIVAVVISPDSLRMKKYEDTAAVVAVGRLADGSTVPVNVTWSSNGVSMLPDGRVTPLNLPNGRYSLVATEVGGAGLADTIPVILHQTTGESVIGPNFWSPVAGVLHLCTSNHFTDDPAGLGGTATITALPDLGVTTAIKPYTTLGWGSYSPAGTSIDFVKVVCEPVWQAPADLTDSVLVVVRVASNRPGSGMAKIFTYENRNNPTSRADYTKVRDWVPPTFTVATVAESVWVKPTNGANIWFKNTYVP